MCNRAAGVIQRLFLLRLLHHAVPALSTCPLNSLEATTVGWHLMTVVTQLRPIAGADASKRTSCATLARSLCPSPPALNDRPADLLLERPDRLSFSLDRPERPRPERVVDETTVLQ